MIAMIRDEGKPPYLPFSSFLTALDQLSQALPTEIKKNVFPYHSGALQGQLIGALRFLDLIDEEGLPKGKKLERLALEKTVPSRRANLRPLIKSAYSEVLKIDLAKMTPSQLDSAFEKYGVSGDTKKKAKTFFIKAALFSELAVSPLLTRRSRVSTGARKRKLATHSATSSGIDMNLIENREGAAKSLQLKNGVTLTIIVKGNLLELENKDRDLIFTIMDHLKSYS
jgi:hypothetical protein